ncbi:MAG: TetR/AcrR family transcriptional regulator [Pseudomonadota bacterium]
MAKSETPSAKRKRGRPKLERTHGRAEIKAAALKEFARLGFVGASIDKIAIAANVARPLVHYHFASKHQLWIEAVSQAFDLLQEETQRFEQELSLQAHGDVMTNFAHALVEFSARNPALVKIVIDETRQGGARAEWLEETYLIPLHELATNFIQVISVHDERKENARIAAQIMPIIFGAANFPFIDSNTLSAAYGADVFSAEYKAEHARLIAVLIHALMNDHIQNKKET